MTTAITTREHAEFNEEQRRLIREMFANGASDNEFAVLMEVAKARNLNPITKQIHFVKRYDSQKGRDVWSHQVSIDGLRSIAERTGAYDGQDEPEFEYDDKKKMICCKVRVYKKGVSRPFVGVAHWSEYAQTKKDGSLTTFWANKPHVMLAKCAEALGLRKAFPEDTGGLYTEEELPEREVNTAPRKAEVVVAEDDFSRMKRELTAGFSDWKKKRAWRDANKKAKNALPPEQQKELSDLYTASSPNGAAEKPASATVVEAEVVKENFDTSPAPQTNADGELLDADGIPL